MSDAKTMTMPDGTVINLKDQAMRNMTADAFSEYSTYAVGDYCIHDDKLYKCVTAITTAGAWDATKWEQTQIGAEFTEINTNLSGLTYNAGDTFSGRINAFGMITTDSQCYLYARLDKPIKAKYYTITTPTNIHLRTTSGLKSPSFSRWVNNTMQDDGSMEIAIDTSVMSGVTANTPCYGILTGVTVTFTDTQP